MLWLTDGSNGNKVSINPEYVVAVFTLTEGDSVGKTGISLINGTLVVKESDIEVVGLLNGVNE